MLIFTSSAKTLDWSKQEYLFAPTQPLFLNQSEVIANKLARLGPRQFAKLLGVSKKLAQLNHHRFRQWTPKHTLDNAKPSLFAYRGDIFRQLPLATYSKAELQYLQDRLLVVSGLYGLARPFDLIEPYRLEVKIPVAIRRKKNLYQYWQDIILKYLKERLVSDNNPLIIDLASNEYSKAIPWEKLSGQIYHIQFRQDKNGKLLNIGLLDKKARGKMIDYLAKNHVTSLEGVKDFRVDGYQLREANVNQLLFVRKYQPA